MGFELHFTLNRQDYIDFNTAHLFESPANKKMVRTLRVVLPLTMLLVLGIVFSNAGGEGWTRYLEWGLAIGAAAGMFIFFRPLMRLVIRNSTKRMEKNGKLVYDKPITLRFDEDCFCEESQDGEAKMGYAVIDCMVAGKDAFYLYQNVNLARLVPFRAFDSEEDKQRFAAFIARKLGEKTVSGGA